jgi:UDP-glucose 4-epimerase
MRVIITGANGFIGSHLVKRFYDHGDKVIAIVKDHNEDVTRIKDYSEILYCSLNSLDSLSDTLASNEETIFYHLAWIGVNGQLKCDANSQIENIRMACDCANFAMKINCRRFLISGTVAENAVFSFDSLKKLSPGLMYSVSKVSTSLFIELICKSIGLPYVWMQFSNIYGPNNRTGNLISYTLSQLLENKVASFGPASQPYDFIYVDDLIDAVFRLGCQPDLRKNKYFIGSGHPHLLKEYLTNIGEITGKKNLIGIGERPDDGIKYSFDMFNSNPLIEEIGDYNTVTFDEGIERTLMAFHGEK